MIKSYYIASSRMNSRIAETVLSGQHIVVEGQTYEQLSKRPQGRTPIRSLVNEEKGERLVIYK